MSTGPSSRCQRGKLELDRATIAQRRMSPLTIVEDFDVLEDVAPGLVAGLVVAMMDQFGLQAVEEALHGRVVPAVTFAAHRTHHAVLGQFLLIYSVHLDIRASRHSGPVQ